MRGTAHPGNDAEACPACGAIYPTRGLGVHLALAHGVVHRRSNEGARQYSAARADGRNLTRKER